jgi:hypothetical protein
MIGLEESFAPELASLNPQQSIESNDAASWVAPAGSSPSRVTSPDARGASPLNGLSNAGAGGHNPTGSRTEKHRLSLIFGKRASTAAEKPKETNGTMNGTAETHPMSPTSPIDTDYRDTLAQQGEVSGGASTATDRPGTRQSNESTGDHSIRSRVGSVKKRISLMGMHGVSIGKGLVKKSSKGMLRSKDVVKEED